jgi:hypothetical protein
MSETKEIKDLTDISFTSRDLIGYRFEILTSKLLDRHKWKYRSNPLKDIKEWKQYQRKGVDFDLVDFNIELESKSGYAKVFKSWILRDWIPRFSYHNETRIVIVKPTLKLSNQCLELLFNYGINVVYPDSISYIVKEGNKLLEAKSTKNTSKNTNAEKSGMENDGARTEKKTQSETFRDKFKTKIGKMSRFVSEILNLLRRLWYDKCGSITLVNWIPIKLKAKNKTNRTKNQRMFSCPFRVVVVCPYHSQFYTCFLLIFFDYVKRLLKYRCYDENEIYSRAKSYLLYRMWIYKNHILAKCKCKPKSIIDNEIVDRQFRSPLSSFEPCKNYRCSTMIGKRICPYLIAIEKTKIKPKQLNLSAFMNGDDQHEEEARSQLLHINRGDNKT